MNDNNVSTKMLVNAGLKILGESGFSGVYVCAETSAAALASLMGIDDVSSKKLLSELTRQHLAVVTSTHDEVRFQLTPKGLYRLQRLMIGELAIPSQSPWDKKWRMVMFDVPVRHNHKRTQLTSHLKLMGFTKLRDSTWVHPYPCFSQLEELISYLSLQQFVTYAEILRFDGISSSRITRAYPEL